MIDDCRFSLREGDVVMVLSCHHIKPTFYCVDRVGRDEFYSSVAGFSHRYSDVFAVFRFFNGNLKRIWESEDFVNLFPIKIDIK